MTRTDAKGSLYGCWTEKCRLHITSADETIHAVNAPPAVAAHLQIAPGTACFKIIATGHVNDETPLWHEETFYRADVYEFRNRIRGLSGNHAAVGKIKG
jgi:DNA-binding GntR family transcriptional regulator